MDRKFGWTTLGIIGFIFAPLGAFFIALGVLLFAVKAGTDPEDPMVFLCVFGGMGLIFCLIGLMSMLCLLPIGAWRWMPNPSTLFFYVVGGLGALLLIISVVWAVVAAVRLRRRERQSAEQSPESQQRQR